MANDMGVVKQMITIETRSEIVRNLSEELLNEVELFLDISRPDSKVASAPTPKLDALSQIDEHLNRAEQILKDVHSQLNRLKARIR